MAQTSAFGFKPSTGKVLRNLQDYVRSDYSTRSERIMTYEIMCAQPYLVKIQLVYI